MMGKLIFTIHNLRKHVGLYKTRFVIRKKYTLRKLKIYYDFGKKVVRRKVSACI